MGGAPGLGWEESGPILDSKVWSPKEDATPMEIQSGEASVSGPRRKLVGL